MRAQQIDELGLPDGLTREGGLQWVKEVLDFCYVSTSRSFTPCPLATSPLRLDEKLRCILGRRYGTIQHAGFGLGFERLIMFATGIENIRDVIPFPRYPGHAQF